MNPPISVVIPVYNNQKFLAEAIESILVQTFTDLEMIIVDDGSTDDSLSIANKYKERDHRIKIHCNKENVGIVESRNIGLKLSTGKYIAWMDSDDISMPDRLKQQYDFMERHPQVGVSSGNAVIIDEKGIVGNILHMPQTHTMIAWSFCFFDSIVNPAAMTLRELVISAGGFRDLAKSKDEYYPEDYDLWIRLVQQTQFYNLDDILLKLRKHDTNITKTRLQSTIRNSVKISKNYIQELLGNNVQINLIEKLWDISTNQSIKEIPMFLNKLYEYFSTSYDLQPDEKKFIRKDIASRLFQIAFHNPKDPNSVYTILRALRIDPAFPVAIGKKAIQKIFSRQGAAM